MKKILPMILLAALWLSACGGAAEPAAPAPTATEAAAVQPTEPPAEEPTTEPASQPTTEPATEPTEEIAAAETEDWSTVEGKTDDGRTTLGNPNAPVTMIDYSDFL